MRKVTDFLTLFGYRQGTDSNVKPSFREPGKISVEVSLMKLKVDFELFRDLAPQFYTYARPGTVRVLDIERGANRNADDELPLGNRYVRQRRWKVLFRWTR